MIVKDNFFSTELPTHFTNFDRKEAAIEHWQIKRNGKKRGLVEVLPNGPNVPSAGMARKAFRYPNYLKIPSILRELSIPSILELGFLPRWDAELIVAG